MTAVELDRVARKIPIVYDRNMSVGIAVLARALSEVAGRLGPDFEASIRETVRHAVSRVGLHNLIICF